MVDKVQQELISGGYVSPGDNVVLVYGAPISVKGRTNTIRVHRGPRRTPVLRRSGTTGIRRVLVVSDTVDDQPDAPTIEWLTRVFAVATGGGSLFDPTTFRNFSDVVATAVPHDAVAVIFRDPCLGGYRLAARYSRGETSQPGYVLGECVPTPPAEGIELLAGASVVGNDDTQRSPVRPTRGSPRGS